MNDRIDVRPIGQVKSRVEETVDENWGGAISKIVLPEYDRVENARHRNGWMSR
jgi:hypothetical protein